LHPKLSGVTDSPAGKSGLECNHNILLLSEDTPLLSQESPHKRAFFLFWLLSGISGTEGSRGLGLKPPAESGLEDGRNSPPSAATWAGSRDGTVRRKEAGYRSLRRGPETDRTPCCLFAYFKSALHHLQVLEPSASRRWQFGQGLSPVVLMWRLTEWPFCAACNYLGNH